MEVGKLQSPAGSQALDRGREVEQLVFGTRVSDTIDALIGDFCTEHLGSPVAEVLFRATSVGVVSGCASATVGG